MKKAILLVVLTIIVIVLKLQFEYYNLIFPLVIIAISFVLLQSRRLILTLIVLFNLLCLLVPDKFIYNVLNNNIYIWTDNDLLATNFKASPDLESDATAAVYPKIIGKINKVYNYPPAIVFASNDWDESWIKASDFDSTFKNQQKLKYLLDHEKRHLDITEVSARKAQDSLNKMFFKDYTEKYKIVEYYFKYSDSIQDVFDNETHHGTIKEKENEWSTWLDRELNR